MKLVAIAAAVLTLALAAPLTQAGHHGCATPCVTAPAVTYVEQTVTCYRAEWKEREVTATVLKPHHHEVVDKHTCTVMVPVVTPEKRTIYVCNYVPKEIEREVTSCRMVRVCVTDPCTGCTYTSCKPEYVTHKIKCTVMEPQHDKKEITVNVCSYKPEQRNFETRRMVCEWKEEKVTYKQRYCEMVPYQTKVMVPVCCR